MTANTSPDQTSPRPLTFVLFGPVYPYRGGISHYTTLLARALRGAEQTVLLISFKRQYPQWLFPGRSDKDPSQQPLTADDPHDRIDPINPLSWLTTFQRVRSVRPDILIFQWWTPFWTPVWLTLLLANKLLLGSRVCVICHNVLPHENRPWAPWTTRLVLRWADRLIVQSETEQEQARRLLPGKPIFVVPLPVFDMFAQQRISKIEASERLSLAADDPVLLFFGIVRAYKGLPRLLGALPIVRRAVPGVKLLIAGEFWEDERNYQVLIDDLGLRDTVMIDNRYIPNEEVAVYFSAADLLVAPYQHVTGSGVIRMAEGFGLPAITTGVGGRMPRPADAETPDADVQQVDGLAATIIQALEVSPDTNASSIPPNTAEHWRTLVDVLSGAALA